MLSKLSWTKVILAIIFIFAYSQQGLTYHNETDTCNLIAGNWEGDWHSKVRKITCKWKASAKAQNFSNKIALDIDLSSPSPALFCRKGETFTLVGTCKHNKITFNMDLTGSSYVSGEVNAKTIKLTGKDIDVTLSKKS